MKIINHIIALVALVIVICLPVAGAYISSSYRHPPDDGSKSVHPPLASSLVADGVTDPAVEFLQLCAGIKPTTEQDGIAAVSSCIGRVRGYVEGSDITTELYKTPKLWCVAPELKDNQVFAAVLDWVTAHPDKFHKFVDSFGDATGYRATIIQSLRETFPCRTV